MRGEEERRNWRLKSKTKKNNKKRKDEPPLGLGKYFREWGWCFKGRKNNLTWRIKVKECLTC